MPIVVNRVADLYSEPDAGFRTLKILVAGPAGAGKTLFASTFPNVVYADMEGRMLSVRNRDVRRAKVSTVRDLEDFRAMVDQDAEVRARLFGGAVDTICLDTVDEMTRIIMRDHLAEENLTQPRIQDWGHLATTARAMLRGFRNLPVNVLFNVHVKDDKDEETGRMYMKPDIQGAVSNEIASYVDESFLLVARGTIDPQTGDRIVRRHAQTYPDSAHEWVKDHSGSLPPEFPVNFEDDYERLYRTIFAEEPPKSGDAQVDIDTSNGKVTGKVGKSLPDKPVRKASNGRIAKAATVDVPLPEGDPAPTSLTVTETDVEQTQDTVTHPEPPPVTDPVAPTEPEPSPPEPETAPEPVPEKETGPDDSGSAQFVCAVCGDVIENPDVAEVSEIRFGEYLCRTHFIARRDNK